MSRIGLPGTLIVAVATACASVHYQYLFVWNGTGKTEQIEVTVDGKRVLYTGVLAKPTAEPPVIDQELDLVKGKHTITVLVPARGFSTSVELVVGRRQVNLHVVINSESVDVTVTYGNEIYL